MRGKNQHFGTDEESLQLTQTLPAHLQIECIELQPTPNVKHCVISVSPLLQRQISLAWWSCFTHGFSSWQHPHVWTTLFRNEVHKQWQSTQNIWWAPRELTKTHSYLHKNRYKCLSFKICYQMSWLLYIVLFSLILNSMLRLSMKCLYSYVFVIIITNLGHALWF